MFLFKCNKTPNEQRTVTVIKRAIDLKNSIQACLRMIENYRLAPQRTTVTEKPGLFISSIYQ